MTNTVEITPTVERGRIMGSKGTYVGLVLRLDYVMRKFADNEFHKALGCSTIPLAVAYTMPAIRTFADSELKRFRQRFEALGYKVTVQKLAKRF